MASYYNVYSPVKEIHSDTVIEDSEQFIQGFRNHISGFIYFLYFSQFLHHHMPFIRDHIKAILKNWDYLFEILDSIIKKRRKEIEEIPVGTELRNDMLTSLIVTHTERDIVKISRDNIFRPMIDVEIRANLLDSFQGGIDTTANTFSFIVYYICQYPQVEQKMIDEINSIFPPNSFDLKYDDLLKLKYSGCWFEVKTVIHINTNGIHTHKDHWLNPEIFDPDRFYNKNMNNKVRNKFSLLTFGGGLRICPERRLAMIELLSLMVILFGKYDIELVDTNTSLKVKSTATTTCGELPIKIKPKKYCSLL
ncbi:6365_t:CDS:2 [Racocetra persica]|uniref:6365_t:CDS:1 n=1 Tax=Racocetra persica TaxID=160502 RepID=A0ACA9MMI2_9GLOM|nr:6365_t:CDS:2 [Racocetra persica]